MTYDFSSATSPGIDGRDPRCAGDRCAALVQLRQRLWDPVSTAMYYGDGDAEFAAFSGALDGGHGDPASRSTWDGFERAGALNEAFRRPGRGGRVFLAIGAGRPRPTTSSERT
jgi:hypothetical protein